MLPVVNLSNESEATSLFQFEQSVFQGQGFVAQNLTSPYPVVELKSTGTTAVIVQKNMYKAVCLSSDSNLAIEVANSQLSLPG